MNTIIIVLTVTLLTVLGTQEVFADQRHFFGHTLPIAPSYLPPVALVSYDETNNQILTTWDFYKLPADAKCAIKGDFRFYNNVNLRHEEIQSEVTSFIPIHYSTISSSPSLLNSIDANYPHVAEKISCTGNTKIDIDSILSHETNNLNFEAFTLFLTFYVLNEDGDFAIGNHSRTDELLIIYDPNNTITESTIDWACKDQIGNLLYIDADGISGQTPVECDRVWKLSSHQALYSTFFLSTQLITTLTQFHLDSYQLFEVLPEPTPQNKKKTGGGCNDCEAPTLGLNKDFKRVVDNGFTLNGQTVQVDKWYSDFPAINSTVGITNNLEAKFKENLGINNMKWIQVCLGAADKGISLAECEALIEIHLETNGSIDYLDIEKIVIQDKENLIDNETLTAQVSMTNCLESDTIQQCGKLDLDFEFREAPINQMIIIQVADKNLYTQNLHFNHGVNVLGESVNEAPTITKFKKTSSQDNDDNWTTYTRTDKINDIWTDQNGIEYNKINDNDFDRITSYPEWKCNDKPLDEINVPTRQNCHFRELLPSIWPN